MGVAVEQALADIDDQLDKLVEHVEKKVQDVAARTLDKLKEMNPELAGQLKPQLKDKNIKWKSLFKYTLTSDLGVPMDKRGSGVRRLVLLNFFRAEAERKASSDGHRPIIYAIEEPETSQHPDHQRMLMRALLEIAENTGQVLISTHAPGLAGEVPISSLRLIDTDADKCRFVRCTASEDSTTFFRDMARNSACCRTISFASWYASKVLTTFVSFDMSATRSMHLIRLFRTLAEIPLRYHSYAWRKPARRSESASFQKLL
jgi:hypothetical protein